VAPIFVLKSTSLPFSTSNDLLYPKIIKRVLAAKKTCVPCTFFFNGSTAPWGPRPPRCSRLHDHTLDTPHSQRPLPDNTQHSQQTDIHALGGIRTYNPSKRAAVIPRLIPRGHWDQLLVLLITLYQPKVLGSSKVKMLIICKQSMYQMSQNFEAGYRRRAINSPRMLSFIFVAICPLRNCLNRPCHGSGD
jgi:hypothetical protein